MSPFPCFLRQRNAKPTSPAIQGDVCDITAVRASDPPHDCESQTKSAPNLARSGRAIERLEDFLAIGLGNALAVILNDYLLHTRRVAADLDASRTSSMLARVVE